MPGRYIPPAMRKSRREVKDNSFCDSATRSSGPIDRDNQRRFRNDGNMDSVYVGNGRMSNNRDEQNGNIKNSYRRGDGGVRGLQRHESSRVSCGTNSSNQNSTRGRNNETVGNGEHSRSKFGTVKINGRVGGGYRSKGGNPQGRSRNRFRSVPRDAQTLEDPEYELELFGRTKEHATGIEFDQYDKIPVEISGSDVPPPLESFETSGLHRRLIKNINLSGYKKPTPVQKHSIPIANSFRDLMSCAQTGSGKTAAFLIPMINVLLKRDCSHVPKGFSNRTSYPMALILSPTRELTQQIHKEARKFLYCTGLRAVCVYGGSDARNQYFELQQGVAILVATPGRLVDFLNREKISLYNCRFTVLDEADRMLDMGFEPQIQQILGGFDMLNDGQTMMFSATFPTEIQKLAQKYLNDYIFLAVGRVGSTAESITQQLQKANGRDEKLDALMDLLPKCDGLTLVFVARKRDAEYIEMFLRSEQVNAESIHGNRNQHERERALKSFRDGTSPILIATDVAARGLDVPNVKWVINYDLPNSIDSYVHRIGRTGRCGNTGTAISLVGDRENKKVIRELIVILQESNQNVPI